MVDRGKFIVIEGPDGVGKSEQARRLQARLVGLLPNGSMLTREPTDGPIGDLIRRALRCEIELAPAAMAPLYAADRQHHVATVIGPALARGAVVVCDRYDMSNMVYRAAEQPVTECRQCGWNAWDEDAFVIVCPACSAGFLRLARFEALAYARSLSNGITRADMTIVLMAPLDVCAARRTARGGGAELFDDNELQARVHALYARPDKLSNGKRLAVVNADAVPDVVEQRIYSHVEEVLLG